MSKGSVTATNKESEGIEAIRTKKSGRITWLRPNNTDLKTFLLSIAAFYKTGEWFLECERMKMTDAETAKTDGWFVPIKTIVEASVVVIALAAQQGEVVGHWVSANNAKTQEEARQKVAQLIQEDLDRTNGRIL